MLPLPIPEPARQDHDGLILNEADHLKYDKDLLHQISSRKAPIYFSHLKQLNVSMHNQTTDTRDTNPSPYLNVPLNISAEESFDVRHNASSQLTDHSLHDSHALTHVQHASALTLPAQA